MLVKSKKSNNRMIQLLMMMVLVATIIIAAPLLIKGNAAHAACIEDEAVPIKLGTTCGYLETNDYYAPYKFKAPAKGKYIFRLNSPSFTADFNAKFYNKNSEKYDYELYAYSNSYDLLTLSLKKGEIRYIRVDASSDYYPGKFRLTITRIVRPGNNKIIKITKGKTLKNGKRKITVTYTKAKNAKNGYKVAVREKGKKKWTYYKRVNSLKKTITLKAKHTYEVKVRGYKCYQIGSGDYYNTTWRYSKKWSKVKRVTL